MKEYIERNRNNKLINRIKVEDCYLEGNFKGEIGYGYKTNNTNYK